MTDSAFTVDPNGDTIIGRSRAVSIMAADMSGADGIITADLVEESDTDGAVVFSNSAEAMGTLTLDYGTFSDFNVVNAPMYNSFEIDFSAVEPEDDTADVTFTVTDTDGNSGTLTQDLDDEGTLTFFYDNFGSDIDFTSLDTISVEIASTTPGADFTIEEITREVNVIPEPATAALAGIAGLGLMLRRRRA